MVINYRALVGLQVLNQRRPVSPPLPLPVRRNKKGEDYRWFSAGLLCGSSRAALACTHCLQGVKSCFAHIPSSMVTCLSFFFFVFRPFFLSFVSSSTTCAFSHTLDPPLFLSQHTAFFSSFPAWLLSLYIFSNLFFFFSFSPPPHSLSHHLHDSPFPFYLLLRFSCRVSMET